MPMSTLTIRLFDLTTGLKSERRCVNTLTGLFGKMRNGSTMKPEQYIICHKNLELKAPTPIDEDKAYEDWLEQKLYLVDTDDD